jgi:hypothetical protein
LLLFARASLIPLATGHILTLDAFITHTRAGVTHLAIAAELLGQRHRLGKNQVGVQATDHVGRLSQRACRNHSQHNSHKLPE